MAALMLWWLWLVFGLVLAGLELLTPGGFFLIFFGTAALAVGVLAGLDLGGPIWMQWLLFSVLSVVSLLVFRNPLLARMRRGTAASTSIDSLVGEIATPLEDINPDAIGRAELRGTTWTARNGDRMAVTRGQRCLVQRVDGLMLWIRAE
jgi:membrane protein implicated in regulation of membrane protease activity